MNLADVYVPFPGILKTVTFKYPDIKGKIVIKNKVALIINCGTANMELIVNMKQELHESVECECVANTTQRKSTTQPNRLASTQPRRLTFPPLVRFYC